MQGKHVFSHFLHQVRMYHKNFFCQINLTKNTCALLTLMYVRTFFNVKIENLSYLSRKICYWEHENFQIYIWYKYFEILLVRRGPRTGIRTRTKVVPQQHPTSTVINFKRSKSLWPATCFSLPSKRKKETAALFAHSCWVCCDNLVAVGITSAFSHTALSSPQGNSGRLTNRQQRMIMDRTAQSLDPTLQGKV